MSAPPSGLYELPLFSILSTRDLLGGMPFGASSVVARREALLRAGLFDVRRRSVEDREMWLKLSLQGAAARVNVPLWTYRVHPEQMNADPERMATNYRNVLDDFFTANKLSPRERRRAYAYYHYDTAMSYACDGQRLAAAKHLLHSFLHYPWPMEQGNAEKRFFRHALLTKSILGQRFFQGVLKGVKRIMVGRASVPVARDGSSSTGRDARPTSGKDSAAMRGTGH